MKDMPIAESALLFAQTNVAAGSRRMKVDGTIEET